MARLVYFSTNGMWLDYELGEKTRVGRHLDCDLQLLDRLISKVHVEIVHENDHYVITDLQSKNGTRINDTSIDVSTVLRDGDEIAIGTHVLRFCEDKRGGDQSSLGAEEALDSTKLPSVKKNGSVSQVHDGGDDLASCQRWIFAGSRDSCRGGFAQGLRKAADWF